MKLKHNLSRYLLCLTMLCLTNFLFITFPAYSDVSNYTFTSDKLFTSPMSTSEETEWSGDSNELSSNELSSNKHGILVYGFMDQRLLDSMKNIGKLAEFGYNYLLPEVTSGADDTMLKEIASSAYAVTSDLFNVGVSPGNSICPDQPVLLYLMLSPLEVLGYYNLQKSGVIEELKKDTDNLNHLSSEEKQEFLDKKIKNRIKIYSFHVENDTYHLYDDLQVLFNEAMVLSSSFYTNTIVGFIIGLPIGICLARGKLNLVNLIHVGTNILEELNSKLIATSSNLGSTLDLVGKQVVVACTSATCLKRCISPSCAAPQIINQPIFNHYDNFLSDIQVALSGISQIPARDFLYSFAGFLYQHAYGNSDSIEGIKKVFIPVATAFTYSALQLSESEALVPNKKLAEQVTSHVAYAALTSTMNLSNNGFRDAVHLLSTLATVGLFDANTPKGVLGYLSLKAAWLTLLSDQCVYGMNSIIQPLLITSASIYLSQDTDIPSLALMSSVIAVDTVNSIQEGHPEYLLMLALVISTNLEGYGKEKAIGYSSLLAIPVLDYMVGDSVRHAREYINTLFSGENTFDN